ncbi:MAG: protein-L-isoaspartate(D-aspartate) O-methyltransferase [Candidatus Heimdallarchaeota archaeon]|nr:protein-L-isoaspartate(D-aspartate) O-methyltransferase [Candidatus Heimdallarchaeota archaeon]MCK5047752.1 protein-L-isoaspartate(D-aspartate) O-methyltransferase [Candidatus Heimdallarchaeota archaeon]
MNRFDSSSKKLKEKHLEDIKAKGYPISDGIRQAFLKIPREEFIPSRSKKNAYYDRPQPLFEGQTISAIHMVLMMLSLAKPLPGEKMLEIGAGSGYVAALLGEIAHSDGKKGEVIAIERIGKLVSFAIENLERCEISNKVKIIHSDGSYGYEEKAPYDVIIVSAASPPEVVPFLEKQLSNNGRLIIPVNEQGWQKLKRITFSDGKKTTENVCAVVFVPLLPDKA